jgi:hypothetical protein
VAGPIIRSSNLTFFLARAEQARAEGDAAKRAQVGERWRPTEARWQARADRAERSEQMRQEEAQRKAEAGLTA